MNRKQLIKKLNWFYNLELNQVDLYFAQYKSLQEKEFKLTFERIAYIEQQHVDNIAATIKELGENPSKVGDVISPIIGKTAGKVLSLTGLENVLKINILLEQKAMQDYNNLIEKVTNQYDAELVKILQHNLIDEDLHKTWFESKISKISQDKK